MNNEIKIVIGSWGSYNECNERALGSSWLTLNDYNDWDEILEELKKQGFELDGIDEELFVQDIENFPAEVENWDYVNPQELFETLKKSRILDDETKYELMDAFCSIEGYREWKQLVDSYEDRWDDDIYLWRNFAKLNGVEVKRICHDPGENNQKVLLDLFRNSKTAEWDCVLILDPSVLSDDICSFLKYREKFNLSGKRISPVVNHKEENK